MDIYWVVVAFQLLSPVCFSLQHHGLQHARLPCPSKSPRVYLNSCPLGFPLCSAGKESICNTEDPCLISWFDPWDGKIPWRRERPPTPVFWSREFHGLYSSWGQVNTVIQLPWWLLKSKKSFCQCRRHGCNPWVGKIPWRRKWQPPPVFLPGKFHGWRSLVGYCPWGRKESDTTEQLHYLSIYRFSSSHVWM